MRSILLIFLMSTAFLNAEWINLWPGEAPGAPQLPAGSETTDERGHKSNIEIPQFKVFLPPADIATGAAALIFPGGGYGILAMKHEGEEYAEWLNKHGIAGIVVKYRIKKGPEYLYPVPFLDARRAIRTVRAHAAEWNLKEDRIGVMGSSAGGHLASLCATRFDDKFPEETEDQIDKLSARPDFAVLCYPVLNMDSEIAHGGSRANLTGSGPTPELLAKISTEKAVTGKTPPVFLLTSSDDVVDCRNSLRFAESCKAHDVPVSLHMFEKGGHGYGLEGQGNLEIWPDLLAAWLAARFPR
ncbi:alpha/beta hydrolase [Luteolibacter algae]|uniref:Alpha/beta hydrolase n=1 Tax=Luteolibacter algae TaxID=454151 RepID=A0ABW5D7Q6_9BACT